MHWCSLISPSFLDVHLSFGNLMVQTAVHLMKSCHIAFSEQFLSAEVCLQHSVVWGHYIVQIKSTSLCNHIWMMIVSTNKINYSPFFGGGGGGALILNCNLINQVVHRHAFLDLKIILSELKPSVVIWQCASSDQVSVSLVMYSGDYFDDQGFNTFFSHCNNLLGVHSVWVRLHVFFWWLCTHLILKCCKTFAMNGKARVSAEPGQCLSFNSSSWSVLYHCSTPSRQVSIFLAFAQLCNNMSIAKFESGMHIELYLSYVQLMFIQVRISRSKSMTCMVLTSISPECVPSMWTQFVIWVPSQNIFLIGFDITSMTWNVHHIPEANDHKKTQPSFFFHNGQYVVCICSVLELFREQMRFSW